MALTDVLNSFVQTAGSAFSTYEAANATPYVVPQGYAATGVTAGGAPLIQPKNTTIVWVVLVAVILLAGYWALKR